MSEKTEYKHWPRQRFRILIFELLRELPNAILTSHYSFDLTEAPILRTSNTCSINVFTHAHTYFRNATSPHCSFPRHASSFLPQQIYRGKLYLVFTAEQLLSHLGGCTATTCGKDEVCPSPNGSVVPGGTVCMLQ